jgi:hypothetical protein
MTQNERMQKTEIVTQLVLTELLRAQQLHAPMASNHEARAVIEEEFDELWDEIKKLPSHDHSPEMVKEGVQLAARALRFLVDRMPLALLRAEADRQQRRADRDIDGERPRTGGGEIGSGFDRD